jgi:hypothetical protein
MALFVLVSRDDRFDSSSAWRLKADLAERSLIIRANGSGSAKYLMSARTVAAATRNASSNVVAPQLFFILTSPLAGFAAGLMFSRDESLTQAICEDEKRNRVLSLQAVVVKGIFGILDCSAIN